MNNDSLKCLDFFENAPYMMLLVNKKVCIEDINQAGLEFLNTTKQNIIGQLCGDLFNCINSITGAGCGLNPGCAECPVRRSINHTFKTGKPLRNEPARMVLNRPAGKEQRELLISTSLVKDGEKDQVLLAIVDITESKNNKETMQQAQAVVENIQVGLYIYHLENLEDDRTLRIVYANPASEKFTGRKANDILGKTLDENFPGLRDKNVPQRFAEVARTGRMCTLEEIYYSDPRGLQDVYAVKAFPLPHNHIGISFENISKQKKAEEALRNKEALENLLMNMATELINIPIEEVDATINTMLEKLGHFGGFDRVYIFRHDDEQRITINTHEWCAEGIAPQIDNLQAVPFAIFADHLETFREGETVKISSVAEMPEKQPLKIILESQDILSLLMLPLMLSGTNIGFVGFDAVRAERKFNETEVNLLRVFAELIVSIEERREKEQRLHDSEAKLKEAQKIASLGRWEMNLKTGEFIYSEELHHLLEVSHENLAYTYETIHSFIHPDDRDMFNQAYQESIECKMPFKLEHRLLMPDGRIKWVIESGRTNFDETGNPVRYIGTIQDITERKQTERLLQARIDLLELSTKHELDEVLQRALDEVCAVVDSPIGFYHFVGATEKELTLKAWSTATLGHFCKIGNLSGKSYSIDEAGVWADCVKQKEPVIHNDYKNLPHRKGLPDGHAEVSRELVVPIIRRDKVVAILGVGNKAQDYNDRDKQIVTFFADLAWTIVERKQAEEALIEKQQFDRLQAELTETFLSVYEEGLDDAFNYVLQRTCEYFAADRSFIFELSLSGKNMINTHQWCNLTKQEQPDSPIIFSITDLPWAYEQLNHNGYLHIPDVEKMPPEAGAEKNIFKRLQFKSIIATPLIVQESLYGFLAYTTVKETKPWSGEQIKNIRAIGEKITTIILRQRLLKQTKDAHDRALAVLDSIDALIYVADIETYEILYMNSYAQGDWGDCLGNKCWEAIQKDQIRPCEFCPNFELLDGSGQAAGTYKWQNKSVTDGRWYEISERAIRWIDGKMRRLSVSIDITELKATEIELEKAWKEAEEADQAKSRFLANMSHEIRTPMNVVLGMTDLLCESSLEEPYHEYACMAHDSAGHLLTIIDDILDFSRIEADRLEILLSRVNLTRELETTVIAFKGQAAQKGLELLHHFDEHLPEEVLIDLARLKQVLINLISNAIKFTEKGTVELVVWLEEDDAGDSPDNRREIAFSVKDTGPGIKEKEQGRLFESFSQLNQGSGGTGLGLAISKNLVELMGGRIWLESEPGKGSTFYFTLPLNVPVESKAEQLAAGKIEALAEDEKKALTLLLAEDKPMNQKLAKVFLEQMGHRVEIVANGKEAVEAFKTHCFDAVLMDINMPEMDGLEATAQIRVFENKTGCHRTAIIAMTAYAMKGDREKFLKAGLDDYISKPIKKEALAEALQRVELKTTSLVGEQADARAPQAVDTFELPDISAMLERVDGNTELLEELAGCFLEDYHREMAELEKAISEDDYEKAATIVHGFKGELGNLCMDEAYKLAKVLDAMLKSKNLDRFAPTLDRFKKSVAKYERYFSQE